MTKKELQDVDKVLSRIKDPDAHVAKARAYIAKDLAAYAARQGQLRDQYDIEPYELTSW